MIQLMRLVSMPFIGVAVIAVLIVYGSDEASRTMDSFNEFFEGL